MSIWDGPVNASQIINTGPHIESGFLSSAVLSGVVPPGYNAANARHNRLNASAPFFLTGLAAGQPGERRTLYNVSAFSGTLFDEDDLELLAVNRFALPKGLPWVFWPGSCVTVIYDATSARWRIADQVFTFGATGYPETAAETVARLGVAPSALHLFDGGLGTTQRDRVASQTLAYNGLSDSDMVGSIDGSRGSMQFTDASAGRLDGASAAVMDFTTRMMFLCVYESTSVAVNANGFLVKGPSGADRWYFSYNGTAGGFLQMLVDSTIRGEGSTGLVVQTIGNLRDGVPHGVGGTINLVTGQMHCAADIGPTCSAALPGTMTTIANAGVASVGALGASATHTWRIPWLATFSSADIDNVNIKKMLKRLRGTSTVSGV